jgi:hypothetical protein
MRLKIVRLFTFVGLAAVGLASLSYADPILPTGLTPGEQYRIVFVTSDTTTAYDTNIADYNAFVTAAANSDADLAALDTTWTAIASTGTYPGGPTLVNAIDNIGVTGAAVYNTDGQLVASNDGTGAGGLWEGDGISNPIEYDENGDSLATSVWTGTGPDGDAFPYYYAIALGSGGDSVYGASADTIDWVDACGGLSCGAAYADNGNTFSLYAISGDLTYEPTPEPGTVSLMMLGGMFVVGKLRNKRTNAASGTCP